MLTAIGQGILFGIGLFFLIGPAFFGMLQTSLRHGHKAGIGIALGVFLSDLTYILLAYFGLSGMLVTGKYALPVGITGGIILIIYGLIQSLKKTKVQNVEGDMIIEIKTPTMGGSMLRGYILNLLNPFVLLLWIGAVSFASSKFANDVPLVITFFTATLVTVLGTDILKSLAAGKIKSYLNEKIIHKVNILAGIILIICGIVLIIRTLDNAWG